ncbi:MAG: CYTH domain-containing protein [Muribaculaceae bacterium]|nr:CYTH domain-containing protein [Muribaculaceae bacterium]MDE6462135.1 CYTH domain-containing protein [Muribaculaceae bacterium]MDE6508913.1 CYTH domain-containing protein [Muribaculaceae bacterium]
MALEIERKFLVSDPDILNRATRKIHIVQGYLSLLPEATVRVRIKDQSGYLTVKGLNSGATRHEWEYEIPLADARQMLSLSQGTIVDKVRHILTDNNGLTWEIDVFASPHPGLILAEVELPSADTPVELPEWIGREVTSDPQYFNSTMAASTKETTKTAKIF